MHCCISQLPRQGERRINLAGHGLEVVSCNAVSNGSYSNIRGRHAVGGIALSNSVVSSCQQSHSVHLHSPFFFCPHPANKSARNQFPVIMFSLRFEVSSTVPYRNNGKGTQLRAHFEPACAFRRGGCCASKCNRQHQHKTGTAKIRISAYTLINKRGVVCLCSLDSSCSTEMRVCLCQQYLHNCFDRSTASVVPKRQRHALSRTL